MSILGRVLGTAERTARTAATTRGGYGRGAARRPVSRGMGYRRRPTTAASGMGIGRIVGGLLRRR